MIQQPPFLETGFAWALEIVAASIGTFLIAFGLMEELFALVRSVSWKRIRR
jgi:hypothetical protein